MSKGNPGDHYEDSNFEIESSDPSSEGLAFRNNTKTSTKKKTTKTDKKAKERNYNRWTIGEQKKYLTFIQKYQGLFELKLAERKKIKIHCRLSKFMKTKDPLQCRSHHQKMIKKYETLEAIIEGISIEVNKATNVKHKTQTSSTNSQIELIDYSKKESPLELSIWEKMIGEDPFSPFDRLCF